MKINVRLTQLQVQHKQTPFQWLPDFSFQANIPIQTRAVSTADLMIISIVTLNVLGGPECREVNVAVNTSLLKLSALMVVFTFIFEDMKALVCIQLYFIHHTQTGIPCGRKMLCKYYIWMHSCDKYDSIKAKQTECLMMSLHLILLTDEGTLLLI